MPFSFQLLVEFFFPGLILFCSFFLFVDGLFPKDFANMIVFLESRSSTTLLILAFSFGLVCYFLGAVINGVSNIVIRVQMSKYRRKMIRRKLGLPPKGTINDLDSDAKHAIEQVLPRFKSKDPSDQLNEVYAAARTFSSVGSERAGKIIDYHWTLVRLSRATLLPLIVLAIVFLIRFVSQSFSGWNFLGFMVSAILFLLTWVNYRYREKFLIYTVFDTFFVTIRSQLQK